ncbi:hypothetical protein [Citrobacter werkmanii]|uniref:hypothetical protein n=1 Tax=Citrobacter werkmanii TaxID=67827 RepID=UPI0037C90C5D
MKSTPGYNQLSQIHPSIIQSLNGEIVNLILTGDDRGMYFHHNNQRYYIDRIQPKEAIPDAFTGGLLDFPKRTEKLSIRGRLHFQKNNSYYLLALISRKERKGFALALGKLKGA